MDECASQATLNLALGALTAILVVLQQIFAYFRHKTLKADNQRLLYVVENGSYIANEKKAK
jgi:uncharacterized membrane protein